MVHVIPTTDTCPEAWLEGAKHLLARPSHDEYNLIIEMRDPTSLPPSSMAICAEVDRFLREHDDQPLNTVAGTIFPAGLYEQRGLRGVYEVYPEEVYPRIKKPHEWGRYAMRMLRRRDKRGKEINPLQVLVDKLHSELKTSNPYRAIYELGVIDLPTYDPGEDGKRRRGGPCLSHLSFKLLPDRRLMLTVIYRYHYYIEKGLGNLLGLAQLQTFVARESGSEVGPLVCHSTYAKIDTEGSWNLGQVRKLVTRCETASGRSEAA